MSPSSGPTLKRYADALMTTFGTPRLVLTRGEGCYVWDEDGSRYLDLLGRIESAIDHLAHPPTGTHEKRDGKHKKRRKGSKAGRDSRDLSRTVEAVAKKVGSCTASAGCMRQCRQCWRCSSPPIG